jgi:hypothetical protein
MNFKMPKPVYQILLGAFLFTLVATSCNNKKDDKSKEATKDSIMSKPVDPGTMPSTPDQPTGDTIQKKPVDMGT